MSRQSSKNKKAKKPNLPFFKVLTTFLRIKDAKFRYPLFRFWKENWKPSNNPNKAGYISSREVQADAERQT